MWARLKAASVQQENAVALMQIDMLQLNVLQTQMDNLTLQATLIVGFAIGMWSGETLTPFVSDEEQACIWKSTGTLVAGHLFFYCTAICLSCGVLIVSAISYMKQAAQEAALTVSTVWFITKLFVTAIVTFVVAAVILVILFVGTSERTPYEYPANTNDTDDVYEEADGATTDGVTLLYDGTLTIECINARDPHANRVRKVNGLAIAWINAGIVGLALIFGGHYIMKLIQSYEPAHLVQWYVSHQAQQAAVLASADSHSKDETHVDHVADHRKYTMALGTGAGIDGFAIGLPGGGGRGRTAAPGVVHATYGVDEDSVSEGRG